MLGIVSVTFIIQPILLGTWCALCLIARGAVALEVYRHGSS
jgi:hypothetical protein